MQQQAIASRTRFKQLRNQLQHLKHHHHNSLQYWNDFILGDLWEQVVVSVRQTTREHLQAVNKAMSHKNMEISRLTAQLSQVKQELAVRYGEEGGGEKGEGVGDLHGVV